VRFKTETLLKIPTNPQLNLRKTCFFQIFFFSKYLCFQRFSLKVCFTAEIFAEKIWFVYEKGVLLHPL